MPFVFLFFAIPVLLFLLFLTSLILYLRGRIQNKRVPGSVSPEKLRRFRILLVASAIPFGVALVIVFGIIIVLSNAVVNM